MDSPWKPQVLEWKERVVVHCNRSNSVDFNIKLLQTVGELCVGGKNLSFVIALFLCFLYY